MSCKTTLLMLPFWVNEVGYGYAKQVGYFEP